jgi:hypothetical protein
VADVNRTVRVRKRTGHKRSVEFLFHVCNRFIFINFANLQIYKILRQNHTARLISAIKTCPPAIFPEAGASKRAPIPHGNHVPTTLIQLATQGIQAKNLRQ